MDCPVAIVPEPYQLQMPRNACEHTVYIINVPVDGMRPGNNVNTSYYV